MKSVKETTGKPCALSNRLSSLLSRSPAVQYHLNLAWQLADRGHPRGHGTLFSYSHSSIRAVTGHLTDEQLAHMVLMISAEQPWGLACTGLTPMLPSFIRSISCSHLTAAYLPVTDGIGALIASCWGLKIIGPKVSIPDRKGGRIGTNLSMYM